MNDAIFARLSMSSDVESVIVICAIYVTPLCVMGNRFDSQGGTKMLTDSLHVIIMNVLMS